MTTAESLIGQLYPAILIATLVGMALHAPSNPSAKDTELKKPNRTRRWMTKAMTSSGGVHSITVKFSRYPDARGELLVILLPVPVAQESGCSGFES